MPLYATLFRYNLEPFSDIFTVNSATGRTRALLLYVKLLTNNNNKKQKE